MDWLLKGYLVQKGYLVRKGTSFENHRKMDYWKGTSFERFVKLKLPSHLIYPPSFETKTTHSHFIGFHFHVSLFSSLSSRFGLPCPPSSLPMFLLTLPSSSIVSVPIFSSCFSQQYFFFFTSLSFRSLSSPFVPDHFHITETVNSQITNGKYLLKSYYCLRLP